MMTLLTLVLKFVNYLWTLSLILFRLLSAIVRVFARTDESLEPLSSLRLLTRLVCPDSTRANATHCLVPNGFLLTATLNTHKQNQNSFGGYLRKWSDILICCHSSRDFNSLKISPRLYFCNCLHQSHQHCTILGHITPAVISSIFAIKHQSIKC